MRYIDTTNDDPPVEWQERVKNVVDELRLAKSHDERKVIIDRNSHVWTELKPWLLALSYGKCWFSEAKDSYSHWEVEHFRPKKSAKELDGTELIGYWWLAFDWHNFRICGNVGNRKKGSYFPIQQQSRRATDELADLRLESPMLLDPTDPDDPNLISFNFQGEAEVSPAESDSWRKARATYSIQRMELNYHALTYRRKTLWQECWREIENYKHELDLYSSDKSNQIAKIGFKNASRKLRKMVEDRAEFSAVARACIRSSGDPRVQVIL